MSQHEEENQFSKQEEACQSKIYTYKNKKNANKRIKKNQNKSWQNLLYTFLLVVCLLALFASEREN